ncbi:hypothetical protein D3C76_630740 [compost metagenome]
MSFCNLNISNTTLSMFAISSNGEKKIIFSPNISFSKEVYSSDKPDAPFEFTATTL